MPNPLVEEERNHVYNCDNQDQINAGFSKCGVDGCLEIHIVKSSFYHAEPRDKKGNTCCNFSWLVDVELCPALIAWKLKYPVQCVVNCDGRDGQVVFDSESFPNPFHFISQPNVSVQCLENPEGEDGITVFDNKSFPIHFQYIIHPKVSVQCLDNPGGEDGVMVIGHESFPRLL